jgi:hypothetical protein
MDNKSNPKLVGIVQDLYSEESDDQKCLNKLLLILNKFNFDDFLLVIEMKDDIEQVRTNLKSLLHMSSSLKIIVISNEQ